MTIQKFAIFSDEGMPQGFYSTEVHKVIPSGAIEITHNQWLEFINNNGSKKWDGKKVVDYTRVDTPEVIKAHISVYRRAMETGGVEFNGVTIQTDSVSRANILGASQLGMTVNWKTSGGFIELTPEQINGIAILVGTHVQKCFNAEKSLYDAWDENPLSSREDVEIAFNAAYEAE